MILPITPFFHPHKSFGSYWILNINHWLIIHHSQLPYAAIGYLSDSWITWLAPFRPKKPESSSEAFEPGILARVNRGILYIDEARTVSFVGPGEELGQKNPTRPGSRSLGRLSCFKGAPEIFGLTLNFVGFIMVKWPPKESQIALKNLIGQYSFETCHHFTGTKFPWAYCTGFAWK